jgi:hypothetical protein
MTTSSETTTQGGPAPSDPPSREHQDLLQALAIHRGLLRTTVDGLTDDQARHRPTASRLCLGGIIKHVATTEAQWVDFIVKGPTAFNFGEATEAEWAAGFELGPGESLASVLDTYTSVASATDELVAGLDDLDADQLLPEAPWFPPGARWSARQTVIHIIAETAQHAGHADILRETIDGSRTMG